MVGHEGENEEMVVKSCTYMMMTGEKEERFGQASRKTVGQRTSGSRDKQEKV